MWLADVKSYDMTITTTSVQRTRPRLIIQGLELIPDKRISFFLLRFLFEDDEEDRLAQHGLVLLPLEPLLAGDD